MNAAPPTAAAYGLRISGLSRTDALALRGVEGWPTVDVTRVIDEVPRLRTGSVGDSEATLFTPAGVLQVDRERGTLVISSRSELSETDVVHPGLWPAAAVFARWRGAETFHAGGFVGTDGGVWAVLADSGGGKSSFLATLALTGREVVVDDLLVVDDEGCCAGPRCLDLRPEVPVQLGLGETATQPVRSTSRRRLLLEPCDGRRPLRGFIELSWDAEIRVERLPPSTALACLARHRRIVGLGIDFHGMLELVRCPVLRLHRPRSWAAQQAAVAAAMRAIEKH